MNKFPLGFLDLLGSQAQGRTPPEQSEVLVPTLDMREFYAADALASFSITATHDAAVAGFVFEHDPSEIWLLRGFAFTTSNMPAGGFEQWRFDVGPTPRIPVGGTANSSATLWTSPLETATTAGDALAGAFLLPCPLIVPPGINSVARIIQRDTGAQRSSAVKLLMTLLQQ